MDSDKRNKIQAKLDCPATPEPEKQVCRDLLEKYPKPKEKPGMRFVKNWDLDSPSPVRVGDKVNFSCADRTVFSFEFDMQMMEIVIKHTCQRCKNNFNSRHKSIPLERPNLVYCDICLAASRREAK
jgi:hypothetical protein